MNKKYLNAEKKRLKDIDKIYKDAAKDAWDDVQGYAGKRDKIEKAMTPHLENVAFRCGELTDDWIYESYDQQFKILSNTAGIKGLEKAPKVQEYKIAARMTNCHVVDGDITASIQKTTMDDTVRTVNEAIRALKNGDKEGAERIYNAMVSKAHQKQLIRNEGARMQANATKDFSDMMDDAGCEGKRTKTWHSVGDALVRPDHQELDGQTIPYDDLFEVGGYAGWGPHCFGVPEEDCNCRCDLSFNFELDDRDKERILRYVSMDT